MEPWVAIALFAVFAVGIVFGIWMGRGKDSGAADKVKELEQALEDAERDSEAYRGQVSDHFSKTAELFDQMTEDYKAVYEHLATGSHSLCSDGAAKLSADMPQKELLTAEKAAPAEEKVEKKAASSAEEAPVVEKTEAAAQSSTEAAPTPESEQVSESKKEDVVAAGQASKEETAARTIH